MKIFSSTHDFEYDWNEVSTANWRKYCPWNKESSHVIAVDTLSRRVDPKTGTLRTERLITCKQAAPNWLRPFFGAAEVSHVYEVSYVRPPLVPVSIVALDQFAPASPSLKFAQTNLPYLTQSNRQRQAIPSHRSRPKNESLLGSLSTTATSVAIPPPLTLSNSSSDSPATRAQMPSVTMISQNLTWSELLSVHETVVYKPSTENPSGSTRFEQEARITALCGGWARIRERIESFTVERFGQNAEKGRAGFEMVLEMSRKVFGEEREKERRLIKA